MTEKWDKVAVVTHRPNGHGKVIAICSYEATELTRLIDPTASHTRLEIVHIDPKCWYRVEVGEEIPVALTVYGVPGYPGRRYYTPHISTFGT